ncbi:MAG: putative toxin-antitoxin system toxin component, PIN family [Candidatus Solibacter sp.]|nr:putative toxin-antitoxin system toxin component, PIN family [Candidatus Solibacter sp.]
MRILLDTNLLVRAAISPRGSAREIFRCIEANENHALVVFGYLFSELVDVLRRDRIRARFPLTDDDIRSYCEHLAAVGDEVSPKALGPVIDDPKDQAIIDAAVAGKVDVLCTSDHHFFTDAVIAFCAGYGIRIMNDIDLLRLLKGGQA